MKNRIILTFIILLLLLSVSGGFSLNYATIRYVSHEGSSTPPYTTWETAADSIQKCIDYCVDGDTVIVANGTYFENIVIDKLLWLIGTSVDSTIINGEQKDSILINIFNDCYISNFTIIGNGQYEAMECIRPLFANVYLTNCKIEDVAIGISTGTSSSLVENCIFYYCDRAIRDDCIADTCNGTYINNVIISKNGRFNSVSFFYGGSPTFTNNIVIEEGGTRDGVATATNIKGIFIKNNLVANFKNRNIKISTVTTDTAYIINNNSINVQTSGSQNGGIVTFTGDRTQIKNNIVKNAYTGIAVYNQTGIPDYNLFWNVEQLVEGNAVLGDSNIVADPMFVKDTIPTAEMKFDYHLQGYSPAIDKGDPDIPDVDGSRSDIGMFGGPLGEKYRYLDLAPQIPKNFVTNIDTLMNKITIEWDMNTETDFNSYIIYKDTSSGFPPDSTNFYAVSDSSYFEDYLPVIKTNTYYKITAVDNQENESEPGNEIAVILVGVSEPGIEINRDYVLYQNYPNPFNPTTKIGYQVKNRSHVKLSIYDIKGEMIKNLVNETKEQGDYQVEFNAGELNLASGIYLYRIEVIGEGSIPVFSDMKKMLLIK